MPWKYTALANTLSGLYYRSNDITSLLIAAGFQPQKFVLDGSANVIWTLATRTIENQDKIKDLVTKALEEYPDNPILKDYLVKDNTDVKSVYGGEDPVWKGGTNKTTYNEKITGEQTTLLPISFLEIGLLKARSVVRIATSGGLGTGFLISDSDLLLTNNHVIDHKPANGNFKVQFNYQKTLKGLPAEYEEFQIDDAVFHTSKEDDWTVVKIKGNPSSKYGYIPLQEAKVKKDDFINIIQHPGGEHKQIGVYHNLVTYVDDRIVQYLTDTLPGSSGSPAFNSTWDIVALHHSGGWLEEPGTKGSPALRNEGININRIIQRLKAEGII